MTNGERAEQRQPICGQDFCEACGDCMSCYGGDPCTLDDTGRHVWLPVDAADNDDDEQARKTEPP